MSLVWFCMVLCGVCPTISLSCGCFCRRQVYTTRWFIDKTRCSRRFLFVSDFFLLRIPRFAFFIRIRSVAWSLSLSVCLSFGLSVSQSVGLSVSDLVFR